MGQLQPSGATPATPVFFISKKDCRRCQRNLPLKGEDGLCESCYHGYRTKVRAAASQGKLLTLEKYIDLFPYGVLGRNVPRLSEILSELPNQAPLIEVQNFSDSTRTPTPTPVSLSLAMQVVNNFIDQMGVINDPVIFWGESGVGKTIIANRLHAKSLRNNKPLIKIDCTRFVKDLFASEVFGYERGAFTGANCSKRGLLELAEEGTVFFDQIESLPIDQQIQLLEFLEESTIRRVGGLKQIRLNVRVIAASNLRLEEMVTKGTFREDLYYRLAVFSCRIPPLRERKEDIPALTEFFLSQRELASPGLTEDAARKLMAYDWPGNVRELRNTLRRAFVFCKDKVIEAQHIKFTEQVNLDSQVDSWRTLEEVRTEAAKRHLVKALEATKGNKAAAARLLRTSPENVGYWIKKLNL